MARVIGSIRHYPARASFVAYLAVIAIGSAILCLPFCRAPKVAPVSPLDSIFTATSATCVTGLTVRSTGNDFSLVGQVVILLLIQTGGLGILTITTFVTFGRGIGSGLRSRAVVTEATGVQASNLFDVLRQVFLLTMVIEAIGFVVLAVHNLYEMPPGPALWHALFHSISAYCNAGFALHDDSLTRYQGDVVVNLAIICLVVVGGLGVPVLLDLRRTLTAGLNDCWRRLHLHSKFMLIGTAALIVIGTVSCFVLEPNQPHANASIGQRLLVALFQSVSTRTAGFNTVSIGGLTNATLYVMILLMMIGAGPCSTGGGFKVSTFMVILVRAWSALRGYRRVHVFGRRITQTAVDRALVTALMFAAVSIIGLTALLTVEQAERPHPQSQGLFLEAVFEVTSALATVGLSTGLTPHLTAAGRWIIIALMFIGRLGPVAVVLALSRAERPQPIELPQEDPLVG